VPSSSFLHYLIERPLGSGAMGQVFLARDEVLHRLVALKFLPESQSTDLVLRERLIREARTLATLSHPHIAAVHALETDGHRSCLVMEYIDGETLADCIQRGPLSVPQVVGLGIAMAEALAQAHERGVVHRDVKPANILLARDGNPKLTDFGIARVESASTQTMGGGFLGTILYMSPEQARGERADARSDLFALGVVLYEALIGAHPFGRERAEATVYAILHEPAQPPTARRTGIPVELERVILKCLEKDASHRYQSAMEVAAGLRRVERGTTPALSSPRREGWLRSPRVTIGSAIVIGLVAWGVATLLGFPSPKADAHTVLILPLEVRGQTQGAEYLGRAFAEAIAVNLARAPSLRVLPVPDAGELGGGGTRALARAALRERARNLVSGALVRESLQVSAILSMTDAVENRIRWGTQTATTTGSLPTLAVSLARQLATELGVESPRQYESPFYVAGNDSLSGRPEFPQALGALRRQEPERALDATRRLVAAFPLDADAHILAVAATVGLAFDRPVGSAERRALEEALRGLDRVDPNNPWSEMARAIFLDQDGRSAEAIDRFNRVLARDDLTPAARGLVLGWRAWPLIHTRNTVAAVADLEEAVRLDPTNDNSLWVLGVGLRSAGRYAEAAERERAAVALNPSHRAYQSGLAESLIHLGQWEEAAARLERECSELPIGNCAAREAAQAVVLLRAGRATEAAAAARRVASQRETALGDYALACYRLLRHERIEALRLLGKAVALGYEDREMTKDSNLKALSEDPQFQSLASRLKQRLESKPIDLSR
jgi:serine/threonine-protein kinase